MYCLCEREALLRALTIGADLCRAFSNVFQITFSARSACETSIEVLVWQETSGVGVWATVPADVREAGVITVQARLAADVLKTIPGDRIALSSVLIEESVPVSENDRFTPLSAGPAFQIESTNETGRRQRTRLRPVVPPAELSLEALLATWRPSGIPLASLEPGALRGVWEPCLLLAKKRVEASKETPDMDHALVLCRFDPEALVCTATTRHAVAQTYLSWTRLSADIPVTHVLVDERRLGWISKALKQETQPVTLTLVPQADTTALLLFSLSQVTLICRVTTAPLPLIWEQRVHAPASQVLLLSRVLLARSLDFLAADRAHGAARSILLRAEGRHLCVQWDPLAQEDHAACELPLANTVPECAPVQVHLRSLREMLRQFKEPVVCLEQGEIPLRKRAEETEDPVPLSFVRLSQPAKETIQMLTVVERVPSPSQMSAPANAAPEPAEADAKGEALAPV
jgi:hypothetical protein